MIEREASVVGKSRSLSRWKHRQLRDEGWERIEWRRLVVTVGRVNTARLLDMCGNHG
jgi:hypothetical protein